MLVLYFLLVGTQKQRGPQFVYTLKRTRTEICMYSEKYLTAIQKKCLL